MNVKFYCWACGKYLDEFSKQGDSVKFMMEESNLQCSCGDGRIKITAERLSFIMEKSIDEQVKDIIRMEIAKFTFPLPDVDLTIQAIESRTEQIMLKIRPYLKVKKKWIGDAL